MEVLFPSFIDKKQMFDYDLNEDPDIEVMLNYPKGVRRLMGADSLLNLYNQGSYIKSITFSVNWNTENQRRLVKFTNIRNGNKVIEEMIHQCLPDPYGNLYVLGIEEPRSFAWKYYLLDLLTNTDSNQWH